MNKTDFTPDDMKNPVSFIKSISDKFDPFSEFIASLLSAGSIKAIEEYTEDKKLLEECIQLLTKDLNSILTMDDFYTKASNYAQIFIKQEVLETLDKCKADICKKNRFIIEGAYPKVFGIRKETQKAHVDKSIYTPSYKMGPRTSYSIMADPKHLLFVLARYKFCSKMLAGKKNVLEIGCGDAVGAPIISQTVNQLTCIDRLDALIKGNQERLSAFKNIEFKTMDISQKGYEEQAFDAAFSIDVLEHVNSDLEKAYMENICSGLRDHAVFIIGTPNITTEKFESEPGASPHINLKSHRTLKELIDRYFVHSNIFSMNDEVVHTGFYPMAHYLFGIGYSLKK